MYLPCIAGDSVKKSGIYFFAYVFNTAAVGAPLHYLPSFSFSLSFDSFRRFRRFRLSHVYILQNCCVCVCIYALHTVRICMGVENKKAQRDRMIVAAIRDIGIYMYSMWWLNTDSLSMSTLYSHKEYVILLLGMWEFRNEGSRVNESKRMKGANRGEQKNPSYNFNASMCVGCWERERKRKKKKQQQQQQTWSKRMEWANERNTREKLKHKNWNLTQARRHSSL